MLLILAGVSISYIANGGIINKTEVAMDMYENANKKQQDIINEIDDYMKEEISNNNSGEDTSGNENNTGGSGGEPGETPSVDKGGLADEDTTITTDDPNVQIVIPKGFAPVILQTDRTDSLPGENGAVKEIMPVKDWNNITAEQINKGIVVVDHAITYDNGKASGTVPDFNEYVWVPITDNSKFVRNGWNRDSLADVSTINKYWEDTTSLEYTNMVNSVSLNKGFYISRYEASKKNSTTAQSKRGQYPWVNVSYTTSKTASSNMKLSINSHLIYGIEWDSILQWALDSGAVIGAETGGTKAITEDDIQSDSKSWGNFSNSTGGAATNSGSRKPGGTNEYWKVNNIYDIAGNVSERTQEKYSTVTTYCVDRGGRCTENTVYSLVAIRVVDGVSTTGDRTRV